MMISSTSAYLFLKAVNVILSKGNSFPRYGKPNTECTVVPLTLILATPVGARINACDFSGEPPLYYSNFITD